MSQIYVQGGAAIAALPGAPLFFDFDKDIGGAALLDGWWQADDGYMLPAYTPPAVGPIDTVLNQRAVAVGAPPAAALVQPGVNSQPGLIRNALNTRSAWRFRRGTGSGGAALPDMLIYNSFPTGPAHTKVIFVRPGGYDGPPEAPVALPTAGRLWGGSNHWISLSDPDGSNNITVQHRLGSSGSISATVANIPYYTWLMLIATEEYDAGTGVYTAGLSVNGAAFVTATGTGIAGPDANSTLGARSSDAGGAGCQCDVLGGLIYTGSLRLSGNAADLSAVKALGRSRYGMAIA